MRSTGASTHPRGGDRHLGPVGPKQSPALTVTLEADWSEQLEFAA